MDVYTISDETDVRSEEKAGGAMGMNDACSYDYGVADAACGS